MESAEIFGEPKEVHADAVLRQRRRIAPTHPFATPRTRAREGLREPGSRRRRLAPPPPPRRDASTLQRLTPPTYRSAPTSWSSARATTTRRAGASSRRSSAGGFTARCRSTRPTCPRGARRTPCPSPAATSSASAGRTRSTWATSRASTSSSARTRTRRRPARRRRRPCPRPSGATRATSRPRSGATPAASSRRPTASRRRTARANTSSATSAARRGTRGDAFRRFLRSPRARAPERASRDGHPSETRDATSNASRRRYYAVRGVCFFRTEDEALANWNAGLPLVQVLQISPKEARLVAASRGGAPPSPSPPPSLPPLARDES